MGWFRILSVNELYNNYYNVIKTNTQLLSDGDTITITYENWAAAMTAAGKVPTDETNYICFKCATGGTWPGGSSRPECGLPGTATVIDSNCHSGVQCTQAQTGTATPEVQLTYQDSATSWKTNLRIGICGNTPLGSQRWPGEQDEKWLDLALRNAAWPPPPPASPPAGPPGVPIVVEMYAAGDAASMCTDAFKTSIANSVAAAMGALANSVTVTCVVASVKYTVTIQAPQASEQAARDHLATIFKTAASTTTELAVAGVTITGTPLVDGQVASGAGCAHWCNQYTCGYSQCAGCTACVGLEASIHCSWWCNVYTCDVWGGYCAGCNVCASLEANTHCEPWCSAFTCWVRGGFCEGCLSCGGTPSTTSPWASPFST